MTVQVCFVLKRESVVVCARKIHRLAAQVDPGLGKVVDHR